jgi:site-specific DNA recombinase
LERPALQQLLADVAAGKIDVVVVYKIDRLTRSLLDFTRIVEIFDRGNVSFVSVTQQFNTTTSMGRLTLNVLLSFAQFEREVTGERIRDKIAASKRKGMWMGGQPPLGYDVKDRKLAINPDEADIVRIIFRRYLDLKSVRTLKESLDASGVVSKARTASDGSAYGSKPIAMVPSTTCSRTASTAVRSFTRTRAIRANIRQSSMRGCGMTFRPFSPATGSAGPTARPQRRRAC